MDSMSGKPKYLANLFKLFQLSVNSFWLFWVTNAFRIIQSGQNTLFPGNLAWDTRSGREANKKIPYGGKMYLAWMVYNFYNLFNKTAVQFHSPVPNSAVVWHEDVENVNLHWSTKKATTTNERQLRFILGSHLRKDTVYYTRASNFYPRSRL